MVISLSASWAYSDRLNRKALFYFLKELIFVPFPWQHDPLWRIQPNNRLSGPLVMESESRKAREFKIGVAGFSQKWIICKDIASLGFFLKKKCMTPAHVYMFFFGYSFDRNLRLTFHKKLNILFKCTIFHKSLGGH